MLLSPSSEKEGSGVSASDRDDRVLLAGRCPSERREASEAGLPAAYELMIFFKAYRQLLNVRKARAG